VRTASYGPTKPTATTPGVDRITSRTYDGLDRLASETVMLEDGSTATLRHTYWRNGLRKTTTDSAERVTFYEYDGRNRLHRVTIGHGLPDPQVVTYEYWPDSLLKSVTYPNGTAASYEYDRADRLVHLTVERAGTLIVSYEYDYDENGNRKSQVETNGGEAETTSYGYDDLDRLISVSYPDGTSVTYGYDGVGNRIAETVKDAAGVVVSSKTAAFDAINRLSQVTDSVDSSNDATLTYDENGNLRTRTTASATVQFTYDLRDLLVETSEGSSITARFAYDAFGRRYLKIGADGLRQYLYDDTSLLQELDAEQQDVARYEYGADRLVSVLRRDEPRRFYHQDALGSVTALTDASGEVAARYHLDAWGNFRFPTELDSSKNRFAFTGHIFDSETGLYNAKARYFDPKLGRFLTQDSYLGQIDVPPSLHRYVYGYANPRRFTDSTGHLVDQAEVARRAAELQQNAPGIVTTITGAVATVATAPVAAAAAAAVVVVGGAKLYEHWTESKLREQEHLAGLLPIQLRQRATVGEKNAAGPDDDPKPVTPPQRGRVVLPGEDAAEKLHDERRREQARASGVELGAVERPLVRRPGEKTGTLRAIDDPGVAELVASIRKRYPEMDIKVGEKRAASDGRTLELDIELPHAIIEVKGNRGAGLGRQIEERLDPAFNPEGKPVIGYSAHEKGLSSFTQAEIERRGGIAADKPNLETLLDILAPDPK
jgi:RHS repeat-associated protein